MAKSTLIRRRKPRRVPELTPDEWEYDWQSYWKEVGFTPYELPRHRIQAESRV